MKNNKIAIIGSGNVATHLFKAFQGNLDVSLINPHHPEDVSDDTDIVIISVSDDAISEVSSKLSDFNGIVAHTSGSQPIDIIKGHDSGKTGVFYPLQTFSKDIALNYSKIPFFIEGGSKNTSKLLFSVAKLLSPEVSYADSELRKKLHIASVFSCNFVNHLWALAESLLKVDDIPLSVLTPLIEETLRKISISSPLDTQTGPARRGDEEILKSHIEYLKKEHPEMTNVYKVITESILSTYHKNNERNKL